MKKAIFPLIILAALIAAILMFSSRFTVTDTLYVHWQEGKVSIRGKGSAGLKWQSTRGMLSMSANETVGHSLTIYLSGECDSGQFEFTADKETHLILQGLRLSNAISPAILLKGKARTIITLQDSTRTQLGDAGIEAKGDLTIMGNGTLQIASRLTGNKGIEIGGDLIINDNPTIIVTTSGQPESRTELAPPADAPGFNGNPDEGLPPLPPGFVKYDYAGTAKAIKAKGDIHINGGTITLRTSTPGAEGLEAKGSLYINGGTISVEAHDDAINVGMDMTVTDGEVNATSTNADGIDINGGQLKPGAKPAKGWKAKKASQLADKPIYTQTGGSVKASTTAKGPEEGLDTDQRPINHIDGQLIVQPSDTLSGLPPQPGQ